MNTTRPNFLILCTDQMRANHAGYAGNPAIHTPRLDALAAEGVSLSRAYVNCPLCMPGRATLFTGLTPRGHRVRTNAIPLDPSFPTVPGAMFSEEYQVDMLTRYIEVLEARPYVVGQHVWNLCDFKTSQGAVRMGGMNFKGVFTRDRRPKLSAHRLRELWRDQDE